MENKYIISVDLGGTKILAALINRKGEIVNRSKIPTDTSKGRVFLVKKLAEAVNNVINEGEVDVKDVKAICVGVPGSVDPFEGKIGTAPNLNIRNFNIKQEFSKYFDIPIVIENDVNLAALGIQKFELKNDGKNVLVVFVGTGIGGAFIFDGKIYRGTSNFAGEIGHMNIEEKGPLCGCGKKGCFEAVAGRLAIVRDIKKDLKNYPKSILHDSIKNKKPIKSKSLSLAVKKNDPVAVKHVLNASKHIGITLANITNLLNLDLIVLGGGVIEALDKFMMPNIKKSFKDYVLKDANKVVKISVTRLGDDAALYGGVALAEEFKLFG